MTLYAARRFVNSYNSLFYIAFLKKHDPAVKGCASGGASGAIHCAALRGDLEADAYQALSAQTA